MLHALEVARFLIIAMLLFLLLNFVAVSINEITLLLFDVGCIFTISVDELYFEHFNVSEAGAD